MDGDHERSEVTVAEGEAIRSSTIVKRVPLTNDIGEVSRQVVAATYVESRKSRSIEEEEEEEEVEEEEEEEKGEEGVGPSSFFRRCSVYTMRQVDDVREMEGKGKKVKDNFDFRW
ncbi:hypothetical protein HZH68_009224 [Vespula germanica]|uniref:Uncharacterized protein n=1 Tax=Vespula germanica TaxID=30212 RepID=A0A834JYB1_VESGE|nr:hypothetical protein HZH68_009224 [Vespula germanica]